MHDPVQRVLLLLEILQARDRIGGAELAARLEIDLRTVQRYVRRLKALGIPVEASPGVGGAYRLRPGYRLPPLVLTNEEAFALALGLRTLRSIGLSAFAPATEGALAKLGRVLPRPLRASLETVDAVVALEPGAWVVPAAMGSLIAVAAAIRNARVLRFTYRTHAGAASVRTVEPYAVLHADDRWYVVGRCLDRAALRTFRLDRMDAIEAGEATFEPPAGFDARAYLQERMPFVQSEHVIDVWLAMTEAEARGHFALWRVAVEPEGGGVRVRCGRDGLHLFAAMLLATGRRIVVRTPEELRTAFAELAALAGQAAADRDETLLP